MRLRGQPNGYAMVALLISLSVMAIMMTVVMPVWRQTARREKEAELVFRGEQYARAINLLQRKSVGALPPSIDFLVEQKFLRKKFKDPITNDDFAPVLLSVAAPQGGAPGSQPGGGASPGGSPGSGRGAATTGATGGSTPGSPTGAGITGVTSKSKETSLRLYKGRNHYNEWLFVFTPPAAQPGAGGAPGAGPRGGGPRGGGPNGPPGSGGPNGPNPPGGPGNPTGPGRGGPPGFGPFPPVGR
jgi:type II secretory pathway pseudopilin PulG